ncbi:hypothetical protein JTB14_008704 [Gonioctena quinquepunctata]|nr:hypothetical protein JTB14_008704 [Gonioctena quinquepunctata]
MPCTIAKYSTTPERITASQADLVAIAKWRQDWSIPLNEGKCAVLHLGKNNPKHTYPTSKGSVASVNLGIEINSKLSWSEHITSITKLNDGEEVISYKPTVCFITPLLFNNDTHLHGHSLKLKRENFHTSARLHFLPNRVFYGWNSLPEEVVSAPGINTFKNRYDKYCEVHLFTDAF